MCITHSYDLPLLPFHAVIKRGTTAHSWLSKVEEVTQRICGSKHKKMQVLRQRNDRAIFRWRAIGTYRKMRMTYHEWTKQRERARFKDSKRLMSLR